MHGNSKYSPLLMVCGRREDESSCLEYIILNWVYQTRTGKIASSLHVWRWSTAIQHCSLSDRSPFKKNKTSFQLLFLCAAAEIIKFLNESLRLTAADRTRLSSSLSWSFLACFRFQEHICVLLGCSPSLSRSVSCFIPFYHISICNLCLSILLHNFPTKCWRDFLQCVQRDSETTRIETWFKTITEFNLLDLEMKTSRLLHPPSPLSPSVNSSEGSFFFFWGGGGNCKVNEKVRWSATYAWLSATGLANHSRPILYSTF